MAQAFRSSEAPERAGRWFARTACGMLVLAAVNVTSGPVAAAPLDHDSQAVLNQLDSLLQEATDDTRKTCASGQAPAWVTAKRARYGTTEPFADASDMCVGILTGIAHDQRLAVYYQTLLGSIGGDPALSAVFPRSIGAAVLGGAGKVAIGNGKAAAVTPALAFDAGFSTGYLDGKASKAGAADAGQLKVLAEACLGQRNDAGTCFSVGYMYGTGAFRAR